MTKEQNEQVSRALAIYRGLSDAERQDKADRVRRAKYYRTDFEGKMYEPEQRTLAAILLPYLEQAEREIQREQAEIVRLEVERRVRTMYGRSVQTAQPAQSPVSVAGVRALGLLAVVGMGAWGAYLFVAFLVESGVLLWAFGGVAVIAFLSALPKPGRRSDDEKKTGAATSAAQNIQINITGNGGQIHVTRGQ